MGLPVGPKDQLFPFFFFMKTPLRQCDIVKEKANALFCAAMLSESGNADILQNQYTVCTRQHTNVTPVSC